ncbi:MAG: Holliday junction resolvase RuvX [Bifidobacteriaceae bacterium]|jgi:putative Holliday junction resolvase|nr:Holliday junction resolvase RuvX [Bifidobacteriaceae bacterium]
MPNWPGSRPRRSSGRGAWLGVDLGEKRVGLAQSDPDGKLATPLTTLQRNGQSLKDLAARVAEIATEQGISRVVVGLPLNMDGTDGVKAREARHFAEHLEALVPEVVLQDERLSSMLANWQLRDAGLNTRRGRRVVDEAAAVLILQVVLDLDGHSDAP